MQSAVDIFLEKRMASQPNHPGYQRMYDRIKSARAVIENLVPWQDAQLHMQWRQGEHITLVGHTGSGKTTAALSFLPQREYVAIIATKPKDDVLDRYIAEGYFVTDTWRDVPDFRHKVVYRPPSDKLDNDRKVRSEILRVLNILYRQGGWAIYCDEIRYLTKNLRLDKELATLWLQGRSLGISLVAATQRPYHIPLEAYSQATHLMMWRENDLRNIARLSDIGGVDTSLTRKVVRELQGHNFLYANTRTGTQFVTNVRG